MGAFWGLCWKMLAPRWCFFGYLGRCCGILAPRWRTRAPRRGKIGELRRRGLLLGGRNPCGDTQRTPLHPSKSPFATGTTLSQLRKAPFCNWRDYYNRKAPFCNQQGPFCNRKGSFATDDFSFTALSFLCGFLACCFSFL